MPNGSCSTAMSLLNQAGESNFCSADAAYSTVGASSGQAWFSFVARWSDVNITAMGPVNGAASTLLVPSISLFQDCTTSVFSTVTNSGNLSSLYKGGLIIGQRYYFSIGGNSPGTFKLCLSNYTPVQRAGSDCSTASFLCHQDLFTQADVSGAGANPDEAVGSCLASPGLNSEQNSVWYKWLAANSGSLTFVITPLSRDDIDWVLYDLGIGGSCSNISTANIIRCAAGRGVDCNPAFQQVYTQTGLSLTATDLSEASGCLNGQDGFVKYVDMEQDHMYALMVNNFDIGGHGFTLEFGGTGEFYGPQASFSAVENNDCPLNPFYTFRSQSANYTGLRWSFGAGASISSTTGIGPFTVSYSSGGPKTALLEAFTAQGCAVVDSKSFDAKVPPAAPEVYADKASYCVGDTIHLSTAFQPNVRYRWQGPMGFSSSLSNPAVAVDRPERSGLYTLVTSLSDDCHGQLARISIPAVPPGPSARFGVRTSLIGSSNMQRAEFSNDSSNAQSFRWDFGDGATSTDINPIHVYNTTGAMTVSLIALSGDPCRTTDNVQRVLFIGKNGEIENHTVFTPNGDTINDEFVVQTSDLMSYKIQIFDRYGVNVFTSKECIDSWKGAYEAVSLPVGVYYYVIEGHGTNGRPLVKSGSVAILK